MADFSDTLHNEHLIIGEIIINSCQKHFLINYSINYVMIMSVQKGGQIKNFQINFSFG